MDGSSVAEVAALRSSPLMPEDVMLVVMAASVSLIVLAVAVSELQAIGCVGGTSRPRCESRCKGRLRAGFCYPTRLRTMAIPPNNAYLSVLPPIGLAGWVDDVSPYGRRSGDNHTFCEITHSVWGTALVCPLPIVRSEGPRVSSRTGSLSH
jgi:hypothetical protein